MSTVIIFVVISINDKVFSIIKVRREVLESLCVDGISQDVVSMNSLQVEFLRVLQLALQECCSCSLKHCSNAVLQGVILLLQGEILVIIIEAILVNINFFIDLDIIERLAWEAEADQSVNWSSPDKVEHVEIEHDQETSCRTTVEGFSWASVLIPEMLRLERLRRKFSWLQVII